MAAPVDLPALFDLHGSVAVVTGASGGLGERFARVLSAAGARVVLAARRIERLDALAAELPGALAVRCDVAVDADRVALVEAARALEGRIDVLVNNAGIGTPMPATDEPLEHFEHVVDVNLNAVFRLCQLVAPVMIDQGGGSIVNVASILGLVASSPIHQASYAASKGAVVQLTRELAVQWARRGVRVNALAPGWFRTEMNVAMHDDESSERFVARSCPMARWGDEDELDGALAFLASRASSFTTGHTLVVDGGWVAR